MAGGGFGSVASNPARGERFGGISLRMPELPPSDAATSLAPLDLAIIGAYVLFALAAGAFMFRKAGDGMTSFFVGDRKLPWYIAGTSIVATTFAADTPLAVTGIVANQGIAGNWIWWSWAVAHLVATFFFARMWRRSGVITDAEITELRYAGKPAAALRGFKAVYYGVFINCLTMAWVIAAMVKISAAFFNFDPWVVITVCVAISVAYTTLGGFRGVVITDVVQFTLGMAGAIFLAYIVVDAFGGMGAAPTVDGGAGTGMLGELARVTAENGRKLSDVIDIIPAADHEQIPLVFFIVLLVAGWWRYAEGNGYIVQRLASTKNEGHAQGASLWFAVAHNALRPWPWILIGVASLIVYPRLSDDSDGSRTQAVAVAGAAAVEVAVSPAYLGVESETTVALAAVAPGAPDFFGGQESGGNGECVAQFDDVTVPLKREVVDGRARYVATFPELKTTRKATLRFSCATKTVAFEGFRAMLGDREMGYPLLMRKYLPSGLLGLVIASLLAAFMSTIDTHTNWGASYLVNDLYRRFYRKEEDENHYVRVSRAAIVLMAILAGVSSTIIGDIASVWTFLVTLGAGLGSVSAARWYWSRVTPYAEFGAMATSTVLALCSLFFFKDTLFGKPNPFFLIEVKAWQSILIVAAGSLLTWIPISIWGPRNTDETLRRFVSTVDPPGPGWRPYKDDTFQTLAPVTGRFVAGACVVFGALIGIGEWFFGSPPMAIGLLALSAIALAFIVKSKGE